MSSFTKQMMNTIFQEHCLLTWSRVSSTAFRTASTATCTITRMCLLQTMVVELAITGPVVITRLVIKHTISKLRAALGDTQTGPGLGFTSLQLCW